MTSPNLQMLARDYAWVREQAAEIGNGVAVQARYVATMNLEHVTREEFILGSQMAGINKATAARCWTWARRWVEE